jgi:cell division protein FtsZ
VVATGIDQEFDRATPAIEPRVAELTERLRNDARQRQQEALQAAPRTQRIETPIETHAYQPAPAAAPAYEAPQTMAYHDPHPEPVMRRAVNDVAIRAVAPKLAPEPVLERAPVQEHQPHPEAFIPPRAEEVIRPTRMPRVDELPLPVQRQMEQRTQQSVPPAPPVEKKRVTLMERLAQAGFGRRGDEAVHQQQPAPRPAQPAPQPQAYAPQAASPVHQEYAKRPAPAPQPRAPQAGLDVHGRPLSAQRPAEDDHLEIPAFLRRQSN